jgi:hypothetical protein
VLLTAVEFGLFTTLGAREWTAEQLGEALAIHPRGLLLSLNVLIEFGDAFDYSAADFAGRCRAVGFQRFEVLHLAGPSSAAIADK